MPASPSIEEAVPAISIREIAQRLGGRWVLRGISLSVEPGEVVAVVGHNGSGKTTLLRVLATALRPTRGAGRIFGHDLVRDADGVRAECAMLSHAGGLYADLTAAENLAFAQRMMGGNVDMEAIHHALDRVGIRRFANTRVRTFSSGMQRRTAVARLYLRDARLLLLDEPYNSLDGNGVALEVLLLYPGARWPIFVGKLTANLAFVLGVELIAVPLAGVLFHVGLTKTLLPLSGVLLLGTFGFVTLGTFYAAVASRTRAREILLPLLLLPMLVPVLIAAAKATSALTVGDVMGDASAWIRLLVAFDLIFFTAAMLVYDAAIGG